jgi:hypothetical protein
VAHFSITSRESRPSQRAWRAAAPDSETRHARFPLSNFPPQAGERANESLREFHVKGALKNQPALIEQTMLLSKQHLQIDGVEVVVKALSIRNLPDDVYEAPKTMAATNHRSMQEQVRCMIEREAS